LVQLAVAQPAPVGRFAVVWRRSNWDRNVAWWIDALLETLGGSGAALPPGPSPRTGRRRTAP
ncbi:MAG: hypothetical protein ACK5JG_13555, partial [Pseudomonadota bacterium]